MLEKQIEEFVVAESEGNVIGRGSLCQLGNDLVEIRSLGISDGYKGQGIGSMLVDSLLEEAKRRELPKVMALTYEVSFSSKRLCRRGKGDFPGESVDRLHSLQEAKMPVTK